MALAGSVVVFVGVFLPIVRVPIVGSVNYFSNGRGDGGILLGLAVVSVVLAIKRKYEWLLATALPSFVLLTATFIGLRYRIAQMNSSLQSDLAGNPFRGLVEAFAGSVQLEYGWAVLVIGCVLLLAAAVTGKAYSKPTFTTEDTFGQGSRRHPGLLVFRRPVVITSLVACAGMLLVWVLGTSSVFTGSPKSTTSSSAAINGARPPAAASAPTATDSTFHNCIKLGTFDSSVLSSNSVFTELAWKVDVVNSCGEPFPLRVTFTISDKDDFELDSDHEDIVAPANGTGNARGKMLVSPPEKAHRMAKQGARVQLQ